MSDVPTWMFVFALFTGLLIVGLFIYQDTMMHELAHQRIYSDFGLSSKITVSLTGGSTLADQQAYANLPEDLRRDLDFRNNLNEIVGYNLNGIHTVLCMIFMMLFLQYLTKGD